jgi:hypothetical protein
MFSGKIAHNYSLINPPITIKQISGNPNQNSALPKMNITSYTFVKFKAEISHEKFILQIWILAQSNTRYSNSESNISSLELNRVARDVISQPKRIRS